MKEQPKAMHSEWENSPNPGFPDLGPQERAQEVRPELCTSQDAALLEIWPDQSEPKKEHILSWLKEAEDKGVLRERSYAVQLRFARSFEMENRVLTREDIALLAGAISQDERTVAAEFVRVFERVSYENVTNKAFWQSVIEEAKSNEGDAVAQVHELLDFFDAYLYTYNGSVWPEFVKNGEQHFSGFIWEAKHAAERLGAQTENYLLAKRVENTFLIEDRNDPNLFEKRARKEREQISGHPQGTQDDIIYIYRHLEEADVARKKLGITDGNMEANPVLPIAPGYYAYYEQGRPARFYRDPKNEADTPDHASQSEEAPDSFYAELNEPIIPTRRFGDDSYKLRKLHLIKDLAARGGDYYIDLSKIDTKELHPYVLAEILNNNLKLRASAKPVPVDAGVFKKEVGAKLFPAGMASEEQFDTYAQLMHPGIRKKIEDDFGIALETLPFWQQRHFLEFVSRTSTKDVAPVQRLVQQFGADALHTFLLLETNGRAIEEVLAITEKTDEDTARKIFQKVGAILEQTNDIERAVEDFFLSESQEVVDAEAVTKEMVKRSAKMLTRIAKSAPGEMEKRVAEMHALEEDVVRFASIFRTAFKGKTDVSFESIKGLQLERVKVSQLEDETKRTEMIAAAVNIATSNWEGQAPGVAAKVIEGLQEHLAHPDAEFFVLGREGKIISFVGFTPVPGKEGHMYAHSFNVDPDHRGAGFGESMMIHALVEMMQHAVLHATAHTQIPAVTRYVHDVGFAITGIVENYEGTGVDFFEITADKDENERRAARKLEEKPADITDAKALASILDGSDSPSMVTLQYDVQKDAERMVKEVKKLTALGYAGHNAYKDEKNRNVRVFVFERGGSRE